MESKKRYNIKSILFAACWVIVGAGAVVLLVAAVRKKDQRQCKRIEINISGVSNNFFIDKDDVLKIISTYGGRNAVGKPIEEFNLVAMETALKREVWIKNAELFFDNNDVLQAVVEEREPIARVFTAGGNTFYIDSSNMKLPLSEKFSARVPVFTNFPTDVAVLTKADSNLLNDIKHISILIQADSFLMAMIDQVDINASRGFDMIPKIGNQLIAFGDGKDAEAKFYKLRLFYKKVMMKMGWSKYSVINLQYKNQVVAKIKGADDVSADSLRTLQIMEFIAANAAKMSEDSLQSFAPESDRKNTDITMIQQSMQREEIGDNSNTNEEPKPQEKSILPLEKPVVKAAVKPVVKQPIQKQVTKPPAKKPPAIKKPVEKPKVVMPKKNDY